MNKELEKAKAYAFRLLKFRIRSKKELKDRLENRKFSAPVIEQVVNFLSDCGFIDDSIFSKQWVSYRLNLKPCSCKMLRLQLRQKGIAENIIEETLSTINPDDELVIAKEIARKRFSKIKALPKEVIMRRLHGYLSRRGFNISTSIKIIKELLKNEQ